MNHINKLLILVIILFLINRLANNNLMNILEGAFTTCKNKVENFMGLTYVNKRGVFSNTPEIPYQSQLDFAYINNKEINSEQLDEESYNLYKFLDSLVRPDNNIYQLTASNSERYEASNNFEKDILANLHKILNCKGYQIDNIKLLDKLVILKNPRGIEIEPFKISADISYRGLMIGSIILYIESFYRYDKSPKTLTIQNIKLIERNKIKPLSSTKDNTDSIFKIKKEFDATNIFIKSKHKEEFNMSDDSLIPSTVNLLDYEVSSETKTSIL
jgi:hypothetical protein